MRFLSRRPLGTAAPACARPSRISASRCSSAASNAVGYSNYPDQCRRRVRQARRRRRHGHLPHLRLAQLPAEPAGGDGSRPGHARHLRGGHLLHRRYPGRAPGQILAQVLRPAGPGTETDGRPFPGDQGHGRAVPAFRRAQAGQGAQGGDRPAHSLPHARHQRDRRRPASCRRAKPARTVVDLAIASMSGSTSQPNLNSIVAALQHTPRDTRPGPRSP